MLFSSMVFLWGFLPSVLFVDYILSIIPSGRNNMRYRNRFLLGASLFFYGWGGIYYFFLMMGSITLNYYGGQFLAYRCQDISKRKRCLFIVLSLNLLLLFVFKYFNMMVVIIENLLARDVISIFRMVGTGALGIPEIVLPIGISFFTFQAMSYVIDVYRGTVSVQDNFYDFALYVSFFPQLIAGPIVRYNEVAEQINHRSESWPMRSEGVKRFCYGFGKKVLLANTYSVVVDKIWALDDSRVTGMVAWLGVICYTLQIYYDFSGYSDMAIGLGRMFGFHFRENFNYPYISSSVREFWRRWHISLTAWFREYVYIPLGGNRISKFQTYMNIYIVFLLTGIWHGANFTFFLWGLYYAILMIIERMFLGKLLQKNPIKLFNHIYALFSVMIGWTLFRSNNVFQAFRIVKGLFIFGENDLQILSYLSMKLIICVIFGILFSGIVQMLFRGWYERNLNSRWVMNIDFLIQLQLLVLGVLSLIGGSYNPFIYFQF